MRKSFNKFNILLKSVAVFILCLAFFMGGFLFLNPKFLNAASAVDVYNFPDDISMTWQGYLGGFDNEIKIPALTDDGNPLGLTEETPIVLTNEKQVAYFFLNYGTTTFSNKYIEIKSDLDEIDFCKDMNLLFSTSTSTWVFSGCFNGNNVPLKNIYFSTTTSANYIFKRVEGTQENPAVIKNLNIQNINIRHNTSADFKGLAETVNYAEFININMGSENINGVSPDTSKLSFITVGSSGGAAVYNASMFAVNVTNSVIKNCSNYVTFRENSQGVTYSFKNAVGFVMNFTDSVMQNCINYGNIYIYDTATATTFRGVISGLIGYAKGNFTFDNCVNNGILSGISYRTATGGVIAVISASDAGRTDTQIIKGCTNNGNIALGYTMGGVIGTHIGLTGDFYILNCTNNGYLVLTTTGSGISSTYDPYVGGIISVIRCSTASEKYIKIDGCTNNGKFAISISGFMSYMYSGIGGVIARIIGSGILNVDILNCKNTENGILNMESENGDTKRQPRYFWGIAGHWYTVKKVNLTGCENHAKIEGGEIGCGLFGEVSVDGEIIIKDCKNYGDVTPATGSAYGIALSATGRYGGVPEGTLLIENCYNYGDIISGTGEGGIASGIIGNATFDRFVSGVLTNCYNEGNITARGNNSSNGTAVGIIRSDGTSYYFYNNPEFYYISNCINTGNITSTVAQSSPASGYYRAAGIAGTANSVFNCINMGNISGDGHGFGIVGFAAVVKNCINYGSISLIRVGLASGIVGHLQYLSYNSLIYSVIANCFNYGNITIGGSAAPYSGLANDRFFGGILAYARYAKGIISVEDCANFGNLIRSNSSSGIIEGTGGIVGGINESPSNSWSFNVVNCYNAGNISITSRNLQNVGGIMGYTKVPNITAVNAVACLVNIESCVNDGNISSTTSVDSGYLSGILGYHENVNLSINNCINNGAITNTRGSISGIMGYLQTRGRSVLAAEFNELDSKEICPNYSITNCINNGDLTANGATAVYVGGILTYVNMRQYVTYFDMKNCFNFGVITKTNTHADTKVGGIIGVEMYGDGLSAATNTQAFTTVQRCYFLAKHYDARLSINLGLNTIGMVMYISQNAQDLFEVGYGGIRRVYNYLENGSSSFEFPVRYETTTVGAMYNYYHANGNGTPSLGTGCQYFEFDWDGLNTYLNTTLNWAKKSTSSLLILGDWGWYIPSVFVSNIVLDFNGGAAGTSLQRVITSTETNNAMVLDLSVIDAGSINLPAVKFKRFKEWNTMMDGSGTSYQVNSGFFEFPVGLAMGSEKSSSGVRYSLCSTVLFAIYEYVDIVVNVAGPDGNYSGDNTVQETRANLSLNGGGNVQTVTVNIQDLIDGTSSILLSYNELASHEYFISFDIKVSGNLFDAIANNDILGYRLNGIVLPEDFVMTIIIKEGKLYVPYVEDGEGGPVTHYIDLYLTVENFLDTYAYTVASGENFFLTLRANIGSGLKTNIVKVLTNLAQIGSVSIANTKVTYFDYTEAFSKLTPEQRESYIYAYECYLPVSIKLTPSKHYVVVKLIIMQTGGGLSAPLTNEYLAEEGIKYVDGSILFAVPLTSGAEVTVSANYAKQEYDVKVVTKSATLRNISGEYMFEGEQPGFTVLNETFSLGLVPKNAETYTFNFWLITLSEGGTENLGYDTYIYTSPDILDKYLISTESGFIIEFIAVFEVKTEFIVSGDWKDSVISAEFYVENTRLNKSEQINYTQYDGNYGFFDLYGATISSIEQGGFYLNEDSIVYIKLFLKNYRKVASVKANNVNVSYSWVNDSYSYPVSLNGNDIIAEITCQRIAYNVLFKAYKENDKEVTTFNRTAIIFSGTNQLPTLSIDDTITAIDFMAPVGYRKVVSGDDMPFFMYSTENGDKPLVLAKNIDEAFLDEALISGTYIEIYVKLVKIYSFQCSGNLSGRISLSTGGILLVEGNTYYFDKDEQIVLTITSNKYYDYYVFGLRMTDIVVNGSVTISISRDEYISVEFYPVSVPLNIVGSSSDSENAKIGDVIVLSNTVRSTDEIKSWKINGKTINELKNMGFDINYEGGFVSLRLTEAWFTAFDDNITSDVTTGFKPLWLAIIVGAPSIALLLLIVLILTIISNNKKRKIIAEELSAKIAKDAVFNTGNFIAGLRDNTTQVSVTEESIKKEMKERKW